MSSDQRWRPNVTVAAVVERDGRFLLVEERTLDGLKLNQPAGHLDPGESLPQAVAREVREETMRDFTPAALLPVCLLRLPRAAGDVTYLRFPFVGSVSEPLPGRTLDDGIVRTLWMSADELRACPERHRSPLVMRCIDAYLAGQRLPLDALWADASVATAIRAPTAR